MNTKKYFLTALSLSILSACTLSQQPQPQIPQNNAINRLSRPIMQGVEQDVNIERMQKNLAYLTGATPIQGGTIIPERGSTEGRALTRTFLTQYLESLGYTVERHEYRKSGTNIFTRLMADEPSDEYILVGAHMDSVRNAGADDNASGSTAVLEAATVLRQLKGRKVNLIFAWFDEEELGLIGSKYMARMFREQGMKISSVHTIDMMGWDSDEDRTVELARPDGILWDYYQMVNKTHGLNMPFDRTNTGQSDHVAFHNEGFDSLCISEEWTSRDSTPHYHRRTDTYQTINFNFLAAGTRLIVAAVGDLSLKVPAPINIQTIPHDRFPARERSFHQSYDEHIN